MKRGQLDRKAVKFEPLTVRSNKVCIEQHCILPTTKPSDPALLASPIIREAAERVSAAKRSNASSMLSFGAHTIKNGLSPVLIELIENRSLSHLATNGAGIIHDWEFAFQGQSSEDVRANVARGQFGNWIETGFEINLALNVGSYEGKGYGEAVGALIENEGLMLPRREALRREAVDALESDPRQAAAAADLLAVMNEFELEEGWRAVPHPYKKFSVQAAAYRCGVPFTGHPMFGHDIIYNHPMNNGACLGRAAERDFLAFAHSVSCLEGGVYLSIGSAVMSPMVFEKSMSMAKNLAIQRKRQLDDYHIVVVDLAKSRWDWSKGEPPEDNPDYYLRYNKSFSRMGGKMRYLCADNRDFLLALSQILRSNQGNTHESHDARPENRQS